MSTTTDDQGDGSRVRRGCACARSTAREREKRLRDGRQRPVPSRLRASFARFEEDPYVEPGFSREPLDRRSRQSIVDRRRLRRDPRGGSPARGRRRERPHHREGRPTSAAPGTGTATRAWPATSSRTATCRCSRSSTTCRRRSTAAAPRSSRTARPSPRSTISTVTCCFRTLVSDVRWDDAAARWVVTTEPRRRRCARTTCVWRTAFLQKPKLPGVPGVESFKGRTFHTSRWDYEYTGGDADGGISTKLGDKRVGIIGTGASAVQCIPHLGEAAEGSSVRVPAHALLGRRAATTAPPIPNGRQASSPAGRRSAWRTSTCSPPAAMPRKISSTTAGTDIIRKLLTKLLGAEDHRPLARGAGQDGRDGRLREDGAGSCPRRLDRRRIRPRPRRSSPTTGSSASGRASTTSTFRPSTVRQRHACRHAGQGRGAGHGEAAWSWRRQASMSSTASSTRPASRWGPTSRGVARATRSSDATASRSPSAGATGCARCTASTCTGSRTAVSDQRRAVGLHRELHGT